jgi:ABC-type polysaccharide transport system permease subunit
MVNLCPPAIIYLIFSITQIIIDTIKGLYNTAFIKIIVTIMVTLLLNILCENGLGVVSWIIVFIPFILMTVIVSLILYAFGLNESTGKINKDEAKKSDDNKPIQKGSLIILNPIVSSYKS